MTHRKTKIVATLGPATDEGDVLNKLLDHGVNVTRFNFSHGSHTEHGGRIDAVKKLRGSLKYPVALLQDLAGPEIRTGEFSGGKVHIKTGSRFTLYTKGKIEEGDEKGVFVNYPHLTKEVKKGDSILLDDGKIELKVVSMSSSAVTCKVVEGGEAKNRRSVSVPGCALEHLPSVTEKDKSDIEFGIKKRVDFIALSFVRTADNVREVRGMLEKKRWKPDLIAKIETAEAVENFDEILALADGIMVARGDLAVEIPAEQVPVVQKQIIRKCIEQGKPVITATQMLESMISSPTPTRAEISDIANAVMDGTDAVMLSGETAMGEYPQKAVSIMKRVAQEVEHSELRYSHQRPFVSADSITDAVTGSVVDISKKLSAKAIIAMTASGFTARMLSRHRPYVPIFPVTGNKEAGNKLSLLFGCFPVTINGGDPDKEVKNFLFKEKVAGKGDTVVIAAGLTSSRKKDHNSTNSIRVEEL